MIVGSDVLDDIHDLQSAGHLAKDGVAAVQMRRSTDRLIRFAVLFGELVNPVGPAVNAFLLLIQPGLVEGLSPHDVELVLGALLQRVDVIPLAGRR